MIANVRRETTTLTIAWCALLRLDFWPELYEYGISYRAMDDKFAEYPSGSLARDILPEWKQLYTVPLSWTLQRLLFIGNLKNVC
jgi:hypothetical protein